MRVSALCVGAAIAATVTVSAAGPRINPMVALLDAKQAVFGLYAPSARAGRGAASHFATVESSTTEASPVCKRKRA